MAGQEHRYKPPKARAWDSAFRSSADAEAISKAEQRRMKVEQIVADAKAMRENHSSLAPRGTIVGHVYRKPATSDQATAEIVVDLTCTLHRLASELRSRADNGIGLAKENVRALSEVMSCFTALREDQRKQVRSEDYSALDQTEALKRLDSLGLRLVDAEKEMDDRTD